MLAFIQYKSMLLLALAAVEHAAIRHKLRPFQLSLSLSLSLARATCQFQTLNIESWTIECAEITQNPEHNERSMLSSPLTLHECTSLSENRHLGTNDEVYYLRKESYFCVLNDFDRRQNKKD